MTMPRSTCGSTCTTPRSTELRRAFEEYDPYRSYYRERGKNPKDAVPQDQFVAELEKKQQEAAQ